MSYIKRALEKILFCQFCNGQGFIGYVNAEEFEFEWCECNPHKLPNPNEF